MQEHTVSANDGLILSIIVLYLGMFLTQKVKFLRQNYIPPAVTGGLICSGIVAIIYGTADLEIKFESSLTADVQAQGFLVEGATGDLVRVEFHHFDDEPGLFGATFVGGQPTIRLNEPIQIDNPSYLRLRRWGDEWTALYSDDGNTWTVADTFFFPTTVVSVSVYAGNSAGTEFASSWDTAALEAASRRWAESGVLGTGGLMHPDQVATGVLFALAGPAFVDDLAVIDSPADDASPPTI